LALETISPLIQVAALHLHDAARLRNRGSVSQQYHRARPFCQSCCNTRPPQQRVEFFALLSSQGNNPACVLCHGNILVQKEPDFDPLISG
jgi:hypothetical protein